MVSCLGLKPSWVPRVQGRMTHQAVVVIDQGLLLPHLGENSQSMRSSFWIDSFTRIVPRDRKSRHCGVPSRAQRPERLFFFTPFWERTGHPLHMFSSIHTHSLAPEKEGMGMVKGCWMCNPAGLFMRHVLFMRIILSSSRSLCVTPALYVHVYIYISLLLSIARLSCILSILSQLNLKFNKGPHPPSRFWRPICSKGSGSVSMY